jgi:Cupin-like domain
VRYAVSLILPRLRAGYSESMAKIANTVRVLTGVPRDQLPIDELIRAGEPAVLKGLVTDWEVVGVGLRSELDALSYLRGHYNGRPVQFSFGEPEIRGRPFYNAEFTDLNCVVRRDRLDEVLSQIQAHLNDEHPPTYYVASLLVDSCLPGFRAANDLTFPAGFDAPPTIWIGNRTTASCHYDAPNNIACCAVGKRRFTLFPPEQIFNLYPGPLEPTPGGQAISLVDFDAPDLEKYPRFREALAAGQTALLEPGDAIFVPSMWWHHVRGLSPFNTLVNYWWSSAPSYVPSPMNALYHAIWSIRDRPDREKQAWKQVFEYYVFGDAELAGAHLPEQARGLLGTITEDQARVLRAMLINKLNR